MFPESQEYYVAYILRLWRHSPDLPWQVMLEDIPGGQRQGFPSLEEAFEYLKTQSYSEEPPVSETS